jgi:hypothetical protein
LLGSFEANQMDEEVAIFKRVREKNSEVPFDDHLFPLMP